MSDSPAVLLLDDGELDSVVTLMKDSNVHFTRLRSGEIGDEVAPPRHLLISTPRHAAKVRRGSPPGARPGRPVRIIVVEEDSPSMRRMLRNMGFHLLVRQLAHPEVWRLLIQRSLYQGEERRCEPRLPMGSEVDLVTASSRTSDPTPSGRALLMDISNRGCHLVTCESLPLDAHVSFGLNVAGSDAGEPIQLSGQVVRSSDWSDSTDDRWTWSAALLFDQNMPDRTRMKLARLINSRITGATTLESPHPNLGPLPATECPDLPGLALDDETDPPVPTDIEVDYECDSVSDVSGAERRESHRAEFQQRIMVMGSPHTQVLMGRDLSAGGMRVERLPGLGVGDRLSLALYGPSEPTSIRVKAEVVRDDGEEGLALRFDPVSDETSRSLEKFVAGLPAVESLEGSEIDGMGAIISEILSDGAST